MTTTPRLRRVTPEAVLGARYEAVDAETLAQAKEIVDAVRNDGETALRAHAERLGDWAPGTPLVYDQAALAAAYNALDPKEQALLSRTADRIRDFALAQRACLSALEMAVPGGRAGHDIAAVTRAGCYAPGGRFPLPSSVLMTAVTARAAGVQEVWVASPRPSRQTLAAAHVAGADALLGVGGAHAIAALAFGAGEVPEVDVVVGPGNRWVTAAKQLVSGHVGIDMLAGPSELVVLADDGASPDVVAADLLAQAEHDPDAVPVLVTWDAAVATAVDTALERQLIALPTASTAAEALRRNGLCVVVSGWEEAVAVCNRLAPEHLEVMVENVDEVRPQLQHFGGIFLGAEAAEVFGDYGAGPNHVLPTGQGARFSGGLSVFSFLRIRTWLRMDAGADLTRLIDDVASLARIEGLEAHARAAESRRSDEK